MPETDDTTKPLDPAPTSSLVEADAPQEGAAEGEAAPQEQDPAPTPADVRPARAEPDWKAEARKWESRSKANAAAVKERDTLSERIKAQDADMESLRAQVADFEHEREVESWRTQVSKDTGVPASVLRGSTLEELQAHAKALSEAFPPGRQAFVPVHAGNPTSSGPASLDDQIAAAQEAGDKTLVSSLKALKLGSAQ